jgi:hypothetical protein
VSPVKYELGVYISEYVIFHSHRRETSKSYVVFSSYLEFWKIRRVQNASDSECFTPSSEPFRFFALGDV